MGSRWGDDNSVARGGSYDERFAQIAATGVNMHGEADLVEHLIVERFESGRAVSVLDAGCGTGRVAIELAARGFDCVGIDLDPAMLSSARTKAPELPWLDGDLAETTVGRAFDVVLLAGNVLIFVERGREADVVANMARHLDRDGLFIAGFQLGPERYDVRQFDADAEAAGLELVDRWSTWARDPWSPNDEYQVSLHRHRG